VVAFGGETVEIKDGKIWINGVLAKEKPGLDYLYYYNKPDTPDTPYGAENMAIKVPKESYFVLGDNSASSRDSRYWGFVPKKYLIGKAFMIYYRYIQ
jgi:signal peptidase I